MSELSQRSGVPVPTIKFYLREGLLPPGRAAGATRAHYEDRHLRRLRLIRALADVGGLRLEDVRRVLAAVDDERATLHEVLASAHSRLSSTEAEASEESRTRVARLVRKRRWRVAADSSHALALARALDALDAVGDPLPQEALEGYAQVFADLAVRELASIDVESPEAAAREAVVRTILIEPVLVTLRRLAHEDRSARVFRTRRPARARAGAASAPVPRRSR